MSDPTDHPAQDLGAGEPDATGAVEGWEDSDQVAAPGAAGDAELTDDGVEAAEADSAGLAPSPDQL